MSVCINNKYRKELLTPSHDRATLVFHNSLSLFIVNSDEQFVYMDQSFKCF